MKATEFEVIYSKTIDREERRFCFKHATQRAVNCNETIDMAVMQPGSYYDYSGDCYDCHMYGSDYEVREELPSEKA